MVSLHGEQACQVFVVCLLARFGRDRLCLSQHKQTAGTVVLVLCLLSAGLCYGPGSCFSFPGLKCDLGLPFGHVQQFFGSECSSGTFLEGNLKSAVSATEFFRSEERRVGK